jgi:hypothetical protein
VHSAYLKLVVALTVSQGTATEADILALGHQKWIASIKASDELADAEKRFAVALGRRNQLRIPVSRDPKAFEDLQISLANVTKGACRLADYVLENGPNSLLYNAKATSLAAITLENFMEDRPTKDLTTQAVVWKAYVAARQSHARNVDVLRAYYAQHGGYSPERYPVEFAGLGGSIDRTLKSVASRSIQQKRHVFTHCIRMIKLTLGEDPLPYETRR